MFQALSLYMWLMAVILNHEHLFSNISILTESSIEQY